MAQFTSIARAYQVLYGAKDFEITCADGDRPTPMIVLSECTIPADTTAVITHPKQPPAKTRTSTVKSYKAGDKIPQISIPIVLYLESLDGENLGIYGEI